MSNDKKTSVTNVAQKFDWRNVLPDAQAAEVNKILCNPTTLDLPKVIGEPMLNLANRVKSPEVNEPNGQSTPSKKPVAATVGLDSFSKTEQQALAYKTGDVDPDSPKLRQEVSRELQNDGVAKNVGGKPRINVEALKQYNPKVLDKTDGKTLSSLDQDTREYIQTILGVTPDGVVGPITLGTAQKKGILNVDGTVNAEKLKEATINAEHLKAEEKKYWDKTITENVAEENRQKPKSQNGVVLTDPSIMNYIESLKANDSGISQYGFSSGAAFPTSPTSSDFGQKPKPKTPPSR